MLVTLKPQAVREFHFILSRRSMSDHRAQCECNVNTRGPHPQCLYEPRALLSLLEWVIQKH